MKDITPEDSLVPIYLDPIAKEQLEADAADRAEYKARIEAEAEAKAAAKAALLERLGITEAEARLLLS